MKIKITKAGAPSVPPEIEASLAFLYPRVFLLWNRGDRLPGRFIDRPEGQPGQPRWEIWCELQQTSHPDASNELAKTDLWNSEAQCWMRFLQTYANADGSFAPADRALLTGLSLADAWSDRLFYEEHIEKPWEAQEEARQRRFAEAASGSADYYRGLENPIVGPYANSGWRWRIS